MLDEIEISEPFCFGEDILFTKDADTGIWLFPGERIDWIPGYCGLYKATTRGCIWSERSRLWLKQYQTDRGYFQVKLYDKYGKLSNKRVNRLILLTFIGEPKWYEEGRYKDGQSSNNCIENLEWGSHIQNEEDKYIHGTDNHIGERNGNSKLIDPEIIEIRKLYATGEYTQQYLAEMFGVDQTLISLIVNYQIWTHI